MAVVVFGSINMDLVVHAPALPTPGQTLAGTDFLSVPGGKGANQAVACARSGAETRMIGRVGGDAFGPALLDEMRGYGVDTSGALIDIDYPSGVALITIDDRGENTIIVVPGANGAIDRSDLDRLDVALHGASALLLQLEIPLEIVCLAAELAHQRGVAVILDPAPAQPLPNDIYPLIDWLTPNESEGAALVGFPIRTEADAERAVQNLIDRGARGVILKLGARGACCGNASGVGWLPAFSVQAVDTVAAGDAFNGGLAAAFDAGLPLEDALRRAAATAAIAVTRQGAQSSMPDRAEVDAFLRAQV
jgi:ribokinase